MADDPLRTAWYPPERSRMILNRNNSVARSRPGLNQSQRIAIGLGTTAGILVLIGIILGAVLGTQLNKPHESTSSNLNITTEAPTTVIPTPAGNDSAVRLDSEMTLDNITFTNDLKDPNSEAYKKLANQVCDEMKKALPQDQVDEIDCSDIEFSPGSVVVRFVFRVVVKKTVTITKASFGNLVQSWVKLRFTNGKGVLKAKKDSFKFKNLGICNPNPCKYSGKCMEVGGGEFKCQCKPGKYGKTCDDDPTFCTCSGDPHCKTFDKLAMDYQGTCKFVLSEARDKSFTVYSRNINIKGVKRVSWARYIELKYNNLVVRMGKLDPYNIKKLNAAWVNGVQVNLPYQNADVNIYKQGQTLVCRTKFGLMLTYGKWQARVGLTSKFKNKVTGFCGNFDGNKKNDASTSSGEYVFKKKNFGNIIGNSYIVQDTEKQPYSSSCKLSDDEVGSSACPGVDLEKALFLCQQIKNPKGKFKDCVKALKPDDVSDFSSWCDFDVKQTCDATVATAAVTTFVESCFEVDYTLLQNVLDWKKEFNITKDDEFDDEDNCTGNTIPSTSGCQNTCDNQNATLLCDLPDVVGSCSCPSGTLSFKDSCVTQSMCGCIHTDGSAHFINETWLSEDCSKKFTCSAGGKISTSLNSCQFGKTCVRSKCSACNPLNPCKNGGTCMDVDVSPGYKCQCSPGYLGASCASSYAVCQCFGDPHCITFDGMMLDYQGTRKHKLVEWMGDQMNLPFTIFGKNINFKGFPKVSFVNMVELSYNNMLIRMTKAFKSSFAPIIVTVNFEEVEIPYMKNNLTILRRGRFVELHNNQGLILTFSSKWQFKVKLSADFFGKNLSGLCGNFDGRIDNDKRKADGNLANGNTSFSWGRDLGDSFIVQNDTEDDEKFPTPTDSTPPQCTPSVLESAKQTCAFITSTTGPFSKCLSKIPSDVLQQRYDWCLFDVSLTCDASLSLDSLTLLSDICSEMNIIVDWRAVLKIPCQCPIEGMSCSGLTSPCIPSCQDPLAAENCSLSQVQDVCSCPPGKVLFQDKCVFVPECGCIDGRGKSRQIGETWLTPDCRAFKCVRSNVIESRTPACPANATCKDGHCVALNAQCSNNTCDATGGKCVLNGEGSFSCRCKPGFAGSRCQYRESTCKCKGDIHCQTFDGLYLDYQGLCKFVLVNSTNADYPFTVYGKNVVRFQKPRVSWILFGEIHFNGSIIRMGRNSAEDKEIKIRVDGAPVTVSQAWFPSFQVYKTGKYHVFQSRDKKLQVVLGKDWTIKIALAEGGSGKVEGLCGNNNNLRSDDNKLRNGTMLAEVNVKKSGKLIGDSYVVADPDVTNVSVCVQPSTLPNPPPCPAAQVKRAASTCGAISDPNGVFAACFPPGNHSSNVTNVSEDFNITQFKEWCDFDFSETCQFEAVETAVSVFAQMCIDEAITNSNLTVRRNVTINSTVVEKEFETEVVADIEAVVNFRSALNLTVTCDDPNSKYTPRSTGCPATCENPNAALDDCLLPDVYDACVCPLGFLLFQDFCILPADCGCVRNNSAYLVGNSWMTNNCTVNNTCLKDDNGTSFINSTSASCPVGKQCTADNTCSACQPVSPCKNGAKCEDGTNSSAALYICKCPPGFAGVDCGQVLRPFGSCYFFGNGHLITFDGLPLNLNTTCKVTLLQTSDFSVSLKASPLNGLTTFSYLEVVMTTVKVKLIVEQNASLLVYVNNSLSIEPPYNSTYFELKYIGEFIEFSTQDLKILFSENGFEIKLSSNLKGKTKGVCGDYNDVMSDDLKTSSGQQIPLTRDGWAGENETRAFVESFQDANDTKSCSSPKAPLRSPCSFDVLSLGDKCKEIMNLQGPLKDCLTNVSSLVLNVTLSWCLSDVRETCDVGVAGVNIRFIYDRCFEVSTKSPPPPLCDLLKLPTCQCAKPNTTFMPKSSACPASCKNPDQASQCNLADLLNVCGCSDGFLLFQGRCIPAGSCGCFDEKGVSHDIGEIWLSATCTIKYTCTSNGSISEEPYTCNKTCVKGACTACTNPSQCVGGKCYDTNNDPGYFCRCNPGLVGNGLSCRRRDAGVCSVYGDPHYISFDKQYFDYQGTSKYVLLDSLDKTRPIRILSKNVPVKRKSKVSVLDYAEVLFMNKTFKLQRAYDGIFAPIVAKVNDDLLGIPFNSIDGSFNLSYDGDTLRFSTNIGVTVAFMPMYRANVEAAFHFKNNLTGLCGNFDGSPSNDLQVSGRDVTFLPDPGNAFGNSFVVENETSSSGPVLSPDINLPTPCLIDISAYRVRCQDMGSPDGPFGDCVKGMDPMEVQMAKDNCLFDLEQTCSADSVKIAFLTFAKKCFHTFGAKVERVKELECECTEPYTTCMATSSGCPATCVNPSSPDTCPMSDSIFVCACQPGRLLFNGKCVLPGDCGCVFTDGRAFKIGETWLNDDCSLKLTCTSPNLYNSELYNCTGNKICVSGTCRACTKDSCGSNGDCIETTSAVGYICRCKPGFYGPTCSDAQISGSYTNSHCMTFDKATFDFKGSGEFKLVGSTRVSSSPLLIPFEIRVTNVFLGDLKRVSYVDRVMINSMTYRITFGREGEGLNARLILRMNNLTTIDLPYKADDFDIILKSPLSVTFISKTGISCSYDALESSVTVSLPTTYMISGGISGLLGNFDGNPDNDLITADGRNVSNSTDPGNDIGISYTNTSSPEFRNISNLPPLPACHDNLQPLLDKCKQLSSLSGPLKPLVIKLGISMSTVIQNNCLSDVRRSCSADAVCAAVKRMSEAVGVGFDWRTPFACEVKCPDGFEPRPTASGCLPSCKDPTADRTCSLPDVTDGCTCPATRLFFKGRCVDRSQCGCVDNSTGMSYEIGKTWRSDGCKMKLTCSVGGNVTSEDVGGCVKGVCLRNRCSGCQVNPCTNSGTCLDVGDEGEYVCKCPTGFYGRRCDGMNNQADVIVLIEDGISSCRGISDATQLSSCTKNFIDTVKNFLKTFVDGLIIGPEDVRVSLVTFSSKVTVVWPLAEYSNVTTLKGAIDFNLTLTFNKDESVDLTNALQSITSLINSPDLQSVPKLKVLILLTDGGSDFDAASAPTSAKNLADARIGVCGVGLSSKVKSDVLKTLCSEPKRINYNYYSYVGNVNVNVLKEAIKLKEPTRTTPVNESAATCRCSGDPHCKSFDGQVINYQGTCKILMASNRIENATRDFPPFSLFLKSYHRGGNTRVSWVDHTEFVYNGKVVKFQRAGEFRVSEVIVTVGGRMVNIPYSGGDFTIDYKGNFVELQVIGSQVKVAYSSRGITFITLPDQFFKNKVFGLCGNYDGNPRNDLKTRNGTDVSGKMDPGKEIGDSYIEYYDADNAALLANCKPPMVKNQTCPADAKSWVDKCRQLTNRSGIFKDCLPRLSSVAQDMQADCLFDLEQTCDYSSVELSIAQFAAACMDAGVSVEGWRGSLDLPCECPKDKICLPKGSPCLPTLFNPDRGSQCPQPDTTDVCSCSIGKVLFNGICVNPEEAGCVDGEGGVRKLKESWLSSDCQLLYTCTSSNNISSEIVSCPDQTTCINGKCSACLQSFPCQNGGLCVEQSECQPKSLPNPGCYWMKVPNTENSITIPAPLSTNSLSSCFQSCLFSSSPCAGINWLPFAPLGQQCLLVSSLSIPTEENLDSTQYLWVCSDKPCAASSASKYKCACKRGFQGSNCETSSGTCTLSVRARLETFDGQSLLFRSNCNTTLVKSKITTTLNKFVITVRNSQRNSMNEKFSQPRILRINFRGKDFRIEIPDVGVPRILPSNGDSILPLNPPFESSDFSINFVGGDLELQTAFGLTITCGSSGSVRVGLPPDYAGQVEGLCGDFDGDKNNDGNVSLSDPGNLISKQYFVPDVENPSDVNCSVADLNNTTMTSTTNKQRCQAITDTNGPFRECLSKLDTTGLARLKKSCEIEVDISLNELAACASLEKLLDWCNRDANVILSTNWKAILGCKCSCADGFVCAPRASGCPDTCSNPNASQNCLKPDIQDTCVCPPGKVLSVDRCVAPEQCGCVDNGGHPRQISEQWLNEDCTILSECQRDGHISTIPNNCSQGSVCNNSMCSVCSVNNPCKKGVCKDIEGGGPPICRCPPGFVGKNCEIDSNNICLIYGNGHCHTFDGMQLDYGGDCKITLVESIPPLPTFKVFGKNYRLKRDVFFIKYVEFMLNEDIVRFEQTGSQPASNIDIMLNNKYVALPLKLIDYTIQYKGQKVELQTNFGLTVTFHNAILSLAVPSLMSGNLRGLCGNFNGDKSDEKITAGGKNVSNGQEVADSYIVLDPDSFQPNLCLPMVDREPPQPPPTPPPQDGVFTTMSPLFSTASPITYPPWNVTSSQPNQTCQTSLVNEISLCKQLSDSTGIFGLCLKILNSTTPSLVDKLLNLARNCERDIASYCDGSVLYGYFNNMASSCSEFGFTIDWATMLNTSYICPTEGMTYQTRPSSPCMSTCSNPKASKMCPWNDMTGFCSCQPGFVLHNKKCIPLKSCGCVTDKGETYNVGSTWFEEGCTVKKSCVGAGDIKTEAAEGTCIVKCPSLGCTCSQT